jgi:hypothetical protein
MQRIKEEGKNQSAAEQTCQIKPQQSATLSNCLNGPMIDNRKTAPTNNECFTSEAQRVGAQLFQARSLQVTGINTQNEAVQSQNNVPAVQMNKNACDRLRQRWKPR